MTVRPLVGKIGVLLIVAALSQPPSATAQWDGTSLLNTYRDAVLYIEGVATLKAGTRTQPWQGTGFVVDARGWLLTNSHVYLPAPLTTDLVQSVELTARAASGGTTYKLELVARDPQIDLALFRLPTRNGGSWTSVTFADSNRIVDARQSVTVFVLGYPLGNQLSATTGTITNSNAQSGRFQTQAPINHGNSGGPVFDSGGGVVAMVHGGIDSAQNMNYLIPINYARGLLLIPGIRW